MTSGGAVGTASGDARKGLTRAQSAGFALAYVALAVVGRSTVLPGASVSLVWPASGVALLWLLAEHPSRQLRVLVPVALELMTVLVLTGAPGPLVVLGAAASCTQVWLIVVLLRRWCPDLLGAGGEASVHAPRTLLVGTVAVLVGCLVGAAIAAVGLWISAGPPSGIEIVLLWGRLVAGVLAVGSVGHLGWEWFSGRARPRLHGGSDLELVTLSTLSVVALAAVFSQPLPLVFLVVPFSVWCAARFATFAAAVHATALGTVALVLTLNGRGPFAEVGDPYDQSMVTQVFLLTLLLTGLAVGTLRDLIDDLFGRLTRTQEQSAARADLLAGMTESMGEGLLVLGADGGVRQHNAASLHLARRLRAGGDHSALAQLASEIERPSAGGAERRSELGPGDLGLAGSDGREMILAVTSRPLLADAEGRTDKLFVLRDVTAHRSGLRPLAEFATTVAHDLRGPLTTMWTWLSLVAEHPAVAQDSAIAGPLDRVERAAVQMNDLIDDLLAHATAEGGQLAPEVVHLAGVGGVLATVAELAGAGPELTISPEVPAVWGDPGAVQQLFANLVGNGLKYTRPVVPTRVEISGHQHGDRVVIEVRDHGVGVAPEDRDRIFERFRRSGAVQSSYAGSGLGLSLCRTIVTRHGGTIECLAPESGPGSVFRLDLPAVIV